MKKRPEESGKANSADAADAAAFAREVADVRPLPRDPRGPRVPRPQLAPRRPETSPAGRAFDLEEPEQSFAKSGVDQRTMKKLRRGDYNPAERRDLHGMTTSDALARVRALVADSLRLGHRCIAIVHGRGLHSEGGVAPVKAQVRAYLKTHPAVLAFADAPPSDGGPGAVYVLLRKGPAVDRG